MEGEDAMALGTVCSAKGTGLMWEQAVSSAKFVPEKETPIPQELLSGENLYS